MDKENNWSGNVLVILGMHRSGTSLLAQLFSKAGFTLGTEFLKKDESNPKGHYEDLDFLKFHKGLLRARGLADHGLIDGPSIHLTSKEKKDLSSLIKRKSEQFVHWGWKEPRTCLFIDDYLALLPEGKFVVVFRTPEKVVSSLIDREKKRIFLNYRKPMKWLMDFIYWTGNKRKQEYYLKTWIHYNKKLLDLAFILPKNRIVFLDIATLVKQPDALFSKIGKRLEIPIEPIDFKNSVEDRLIDRKENPSKISKLKSSKEANRIFNKLKELELKG